MIPFTNSDGLVYIDATLGDSTRMCVILDTGAGLDVFAPSRIREVGGKPAGIFTGHRISE